MMCDEIAMLKSSLDPDLISVLYSLVKKPLLTVDLYFSEYHGMLLQRVDTKESFVISVKQ